MALTWLYKDLNNDGGTDYVSIGIWTFNDDPVYAEGGDARQPGAPAADADNLTEWGLNNQWRAIGTALIDLNVRADQLNNIDVDLTALANNTTPAYNSSSGNFEMVSGLPSNPILTDGVNIVYFGKHGNDANDGLTWNDAKLTYAAALAVAVAGSPNTGNRYVIVCFDAGRYTTGMALSSYIDLYAPNIHIETSSGIALSLRGGTTATVGAITSNGGDAIVLPSGTANGARVVCHINDLSAYGASAIANRDGSISDSRTVSVFAKRIITTATVGIEASGGHVNVVCDYLDSAANLVNITQSTRINIKANKISSSTGSPMFRINGASSYLNIEASEINVNSDLFLLTNGVLNANLGLVDCDGLEFLDIDGGIANVFVNQIISTTLYNVSGGVLNLIYGTGTGTETTSGGTVNAGDIAEVFSGGAHATSDGSSHSDVVTNTSHSTGDGSDHGDVADNTTAIAALVKKNEFVASGAGAGQVNWSGTGPYIGTWTHSLPALGFDEYLVQACDTDGNIVIPANVQKTATQVIVTSNSNADMHVTVIGINI